MVYKLGGEFIANADDLRPQFQTTQNAFLSQNAIYQSTLVRDNGQSSGATIDQFDGQPISAVSGFKEEASPWYSDQILPFDITLAGTNEEGAACCMKITGVEILNEGSGVSIDDAVTEMQASFVARFVQPWCAVTSPFQSFGGGSIMAVVGRDSANRFLPGAFIRAPCAGVEIYCHETASEGRASRCWRGFSSSRRCAVQRAVTAPVFARMPQADFRLAKERKLLPRAGFESGLSVWKG